MFSISFRKENTILLHSLIVVSEDTDVFVLSLTLNTNIDCPMHMKFGTKCRERFIDVKIVSADVEESV